MKPSVTLMFPVAALIALSFSCVVHAQEFPPVIDRVYEDETHCLVAPEVRTDSDMPVSCWCKDAIVDARYVYFTYVRPKKDTNLKWSYLALVTNANRQCGDTVGTVKATSDSGWRWNRPEVTRVYPPDHIIDQLKPDDEGRRAVQYQVILTYRDAQGHMTRTEQFSAIERLPPNPKGNSCPPGPVCSK
jgi:hypothetical protein